MNHLTWSVLFHDLCQPVKIHDNTTKGNSPLGLQKLDDKGWNQASMKVKLGGFGLTEVKSLPSVVFSAACQIQSTSFRLHGTWSITFTTRRVRAIQFNWFYSNALSLYYYSILQKGWKLNPLL